MLIYFLSSYKRLLFCDSLIMSLIVICVCVYADSASNLPRPLHRTFSGRPRARLSLRLAAHLASVSEFESVRWCELCVP